MPTTITRSVRPHSRLAAVLAAMSEPCHIVMVRDSADGDPEPMCLTHTGCIGTRDEA